MRRNRWASLVVWTMVLITCAGLMVGPVGADRVDRRGSEPSLIGNLAVSDAGVLVQTDLGAKHFVAWDRVRAIQSPTYDTQWQQRRESATSLWRARSRVERGDTALAEPLLERLFESYRGETHETALVVAEGLLRCRLARGEQALAVVPALEVIRLVRADVRTVSYSQLAPVLDVETQLCPALAPMWLQSPILSKVQDDLVDYPAGGDLVVGAMARLYRQSIRQAIGLQPVEAFDPPEHPGVALLSHIVATQGPNPVDRDKGRTGLLQWPTEDQPRFVEAWVRFFAGSSLLRETGLVRQQRGMMYLLHLPALFGAEHRYLTGVALDLVATGLEASGDTEAAERIRAELVARLPYHPVLQREVATG